MATRKASSKSTSTKRGTSTKSARSFRVKYHQFGQDPVEVLVKPGTTIADFREMKNLSGADIFVTHEGTSRKATNSVVLTKGDIIRVGVKTKNG